MDFVNISVPYEPMSEMRTDLLKRIGQLKKHLILIGIGLAVIFVLIILVIVFICVSTTKHIFSIGNSIHTTVMVQDVSTVATDNSFIKAGRVFGESTGGEAFDDSLMDHFTSFDYIRGVILQPDTILHWIQCFYSSNSSSKSFRPGPIHGFREPQDRGELFFLDEEERISKVQVKLEYVQLYNDNVPAEKPKLVMAIRFFTTKGRSSPDISQAAGEMYTEEYPGYTLGYIAGRSGRFIDIIQFYWYQTNIVLNKN